MPRSIEIAKEVGSILTDTKFNGRAVFSPANSFSFQVGANDNETISMAGLSLGGDVTAGGLSNLTAISGAALASDAAALDGGL